eukprot:3711086-Pyramimonas_sp.AAC.1
MVGVPCADGLRISTVLRACVYTDNVELLPEKKGARCTMWGPAGVACHYTERPSHTWGSRGDSGLQRQAGQMYCAAKYGGGCVRPRLVWDPCLHLWGQSAGGVLAS